MHKKKTKILCDFFVCYTLWIMSDSEEIVTEIYLLLVFIILAYYIQNGRLIAEHTKLCY